MLLTSQNVYMKKKKGKNQIDFSFIEKDVFWTISMDHFKIEIVSICPSSFKTLF